VATTNTYSGSSSLSLAAQAAFSGDTTGNRRASRAVTRAYAAAGGTAPTVSGFLTGQLTVAAGDILLAHASDPFQGMGDSVYSDGFTVAGSKLKMLYLRNCDETRSIVIIRGAANGLPIFEAASDGITLQPLGTYFMEWPSGLAALTTGTNDKLTLTPSAGNPLMDLTAFYGP
jgi:hypothetical protein